MPFEWQGAKSTKTVVFINYYYLKVFFLQVMSLASLGAQTHNAHQNPHNVPELIAATSVNSANRF